MSWQHRFCIATTLLRTPPPSSVRRTIRFVLRCSMFSGFRTSREAILGTQRYLHDAKAILGTQRYFLKHLLNNIYSRLRRGDFRYTTISWYTRHNMRDIHTRCANVLEINSWVIKSLTLCPSTLSKHFIKALYQSTLSKHFIQALYQGISKAF